MKAFQSDVIFHCFFFHFFYHFIREILFDAGERLKREAKLCDEDLCICDGQYLNCKFQRKFFKVEVFQFDETYLV